MATPDQSVAELVSALELRRLIPSPDAV
jgi:hypothetical protein